jgi:hypothetical protein
MYGACKFMCECLSDRVCDTKTYNINDNKIKNIYKNETLERNCKACPNEFVCSVSNVRAQTGHPTVFTFSGNKGENVEDCLRQFKCFSKLYEGFNEDNVHILAAAYLREDAGKWYDDLQVEPKNFMEFKELIRNRYAYVPKDRPTLLRNVLNRFQGDKESLCDFANNMYRLGVKAGLDDEMIIQTTISNMRCREKTVIRLVLKPNSNFKEFLRIVENIEGDEGVKLNEIESGENHVDEKFKYDEVLSKLENLTLAIKSNNNAI